MPTAYLVPRLSAYLEKKTIYALSLFVLPYVVFELVLARPSQNKLIWFSCAVWFLLWSGDKISQFANKLRPQTPSQITSPISAWYSFFWSPPREIFAQYPSVTQCLEFPPRVRLRNSLSRRSNSPRVSHTISSPCWWLIKPWPKDRILSSNIEREEGKQFVMRAICNL